ncbi:CDC27 family protein [Aequorivita capsosiphonis]|uniref:CDC27 family protein n=1 Tax=Aequorivita capsosiphonis TaxID=487317 RepID=UPI0003FFC651|nr:CDC27 family protein [Aequorivita capsosiphonis]
MKRKNSFWDELKRRNVIKGAISYIVVAWLLIRIAALLGDILEMPLWISKSLFYLLLIGFPIYLLGSWIYEFTPTGLKRTSKVAESASIRKKTGKRLNKIIIAFLVLFLAVLVIDRFIITNKNDENTFDTASIGSNFKTIAVLPFQDFSEKKDNAYFADGLTEALLNLLSQVELLKVTSRTSTFSFKNSDLKIPEIAQKLNVTYVLEGSVRKSGNLLRITAQLIDAKNDKHLWSETYDRNLDNIFAIQDEVSEAVVKSLELNLLDSKPLPKSIKTNPKAYKLYLQAVQASHFSSDKQKLIEAVALAKKALKIDNNYVPAWLLLSRVYETQANNGTLGFEQGYTLAKAATNKVLEIDPKNALAYAYLADDELSFDWNFAKAKQLNAIALKLDGSNPEIISLSATLAIALGNLESALRLQEYSASLDPLNPDTYFQLMNVYYCADQLEKAVEASKKCIELQPNRYAVHYYYARILLQQNKIEEALEAIKKEEDEGWSLQIHSDIYYKLGDIEKSEEYMQELISKYTNDMAYQIAESYSFRNDTENAFKWLDKAYKVHDVGLNEVLSEPRFRNLHSEKRWRKFIHKMGFPKTENGM